MNGKARKIIKVNLDLLTDGLFSIFY